MLKKSTLYNWSISFHFINKADIIFITSNQYSYIIITVKGIY